MQKREKSEPRTHTKQNEVKGFLGYNIINKERILSSITISLNARVLAVIYRIYTMLLSILFNLSLTRQKELALMHLPEVLFYLDLFPLTN